MKAARTSLIAFLALFLVIGLAGAVAADKCNGKITTVLADDRVFIITDEEGVEHTMHLELTGEVRINDRLGSFDDLNEGDEVSVTFEQRNGMQEVSLIEVRRQE